MKTRIAGLAARDGSVLMVTLFSAVLIGTVLASYLTLIRHQDVAVARSQGWNAALAMAEAGVEEALAQINSGDLAGNGWGPPAGGIYNLQSRTLSGGRYDVKYFVTSLTNPPTIYSTGYVTIPALSVTVARKIVVTTKVAPVFNLNVAIGAKSSISNGSGILTDSFNSAVATNSNNGHYPDGNAAKLLKRGNVASLNGPLNLGSPTINGDLYLGPGVANTYTPAQGAVHPDFNSDYPDVSAPAGAPGGMGWLPAMVTAGKYEFTTDGNYVVNDGSLRIVVRPGAKVQLYVTTSTFNPPSIAVETNALGSGKLLIYQPSGTATIRGSGNLVVQSERAENFQYFGMPGVTSVIYDNPGGNPFFGVIYAPSANLTLNGGWGNSGSGWSGMNFVGACVGKSITMDGYYKFHFDENLLKPDVSGGGATSVSYVANSWKEQDP